MDIDETLKQRGGRYGSLKDNAEVAQMLMKVVEVYAPNYSQLENPHKEALHMIFHKIARMVCGDVMYSDNMHDVAGYAKLLEDWQLEQGEQNG